MEYEEEGGVRWAERRFSASCIIASAAAFICDTDWSIVRIYLCFLRLIGPS